MEPAVGLIYQAAAIPVESGRVCLVKSNSGKRWVVPKGCFEPGKSAAEIALQEAWEEAGVVGVLNPDPVGTYLYEKWGATCHVTVFLMQVTRIADDWPERVLRERIWLRPSKVLGRITDRGLREVLEQVIHGDRIEPPMSQLVS